MKYSAALVLLMAGHSAIAAPLTQPTCPDALHEKLFDRLMYAVRSDDISEALFQHSLDAFMRCEHSRR